MLIEDSYFPISAAPDLLDQDLTGSLYELLAEESVRFFVCGGLVYK